MQKKVNWNSEKAKVEACKSRWVYNDLLEEQTITVLLFSAKFNQGVQSFPNVLIGVTFKNDTIAILDKDFDGILKKGSAVKVLPSIWSNAEKEIKKPALTVYQTSEENDLYCKVKYAYYSKIEKLKTP